MHENGPIWWFSIEKNHCDISVPNRCGKCDACLFLISVPGMYDMLLVWGICVLSELGTCDMLSVPGFCDMVSVFGICDMLSVSDICDMLSVLDIFDILLVSLSIFDMLSVLGI